MRLIGLGDIHMSTEYFRRIPGIDTADLLIINGDLTNYGSCADAKKVLDAALTVNPSVLAQIGNLDKPEINGYLEELDINLHAQARLIKNRACLIGIGGSNHTPFSTPAEYSEAELAAFARSGYEQAQTFIALAEPIEKIKIPLILVSHTPPYGTKVDRLVNGRHVGSRSIRKFIEEKQPDLCIAGHIHEAAGMDLIGNSPIYNPGMLRRGGWVEVNVEKSHLHITLHDTI